MAHQVEKPGLTAQVAKNMQQTQRSFLGVQKDPLARDEHPTCYVLKRTLSSVISG